jgi:hypothetical protein
MPHGSDILPGPLVKLLEASHPGFTARSAVTPTTDTNRAGCRDPLSDMCMLFPQAGDHIGQLCGIF